jgi:hypothetical protein
MCIYTTKKVVIRPPNKNIIQKHFFMREFTKEIHFIFSLSFFNCKIFIVILNKDFGLNHLKIIAIYIILLNRVQRVLDYIQSNQ